MKRNSGRVVLQAGLKNVEENMMKIYMKWKKIVIYTNCTNMRETLY